MQFCIAWQDEGDVLARMYDLSTPTGVILTVADDPNVFEGMPAVGAGFCEFTVAYGTITPPAEFAVNVRAARVLLDGTVAITDRPVDILDGPFQANIRCASRPIHNVPAEQETNTTLITWYGATGPAGFAANDIRARFFEPMAPSTSIFGAACPGPLGELASIGSTGGDPIGGNNDFQFTVTGAPPSSLAVLVVGDSFATLPIPGAPGCTLYMNLPLVALFPTLTDLSGNGAVQLTFPCSIPDGAALAFQWGIHTPGHNAFGWIVSNDMDVIWNDN